METTKVVCEELWTNDLCEGESVTSEILSITTNPLKVQARAPNSDHLDQAALLNCDGVCLSLDCNPVLGLGQVPAHVRIAQNQLRAAEDESVARSNRSLARRLK